MVKFIDGPAAGVQLQLSRAPVVLRAVRKGDQWDALDQLADEAAADEEIFVYRLVAEPTSVHVCRSSRRLSGWMTIADYVVLEEQPNDDDVRTTARWAKWCIANKERLMPEWAATSTRREE